MNKYKENMEHGANSAIKEQSRKNYEMMKEHILKSRKFKDHPIIKELKPKAEVKKDGKKPKR